MASDVSYPSDRAFWASVGVRAGREARQTGAKKAEILRRFVYDRLLARVFHGPDGHWVLKGGTALLIRVHRARYSKDVDLLHEINDPDAAHADLSARLSIDLGDHLRFELGRPKRTSASEGQPEVTGSRVPVLVYCGVKKVEQFHIDLITGSMMTVEPEIAARLSGIDIDGLAPAQVRLYPIVDHIADKIAATETVYASGPSSRVRDLVDLVAAFVEPAMASLVDGKRWDPQETRWR
ncbi:nucleotidyl transferase AbiEii/AbiGii toxin family protein [Cellulomonas denverensis]|uniref:Nucleotidyl transferase AbiEii/AbiGii toxin family protein n=1 Tax=Cellulomonas denverensis TaxID=264297 RepID=A0A7X6KVS6_9CELL|nr:nucleotidyl transferase AbiEii/AbiGii toxin family protein [Cellulomonas denverensis]NKY23181.1 nucleotidyl transferase AbiEii/AbiGii toxin family protein [Cellulomonas denverensis]